MKKYPILENKKITSWAPEFLALLGVLLYFVQAWHYAHTTIPGLDEGSYLFKGYLYLHGIYEPFQPYGPLTNKAPLAFLIPGLAEYIFGAGLRTGRYFAIFLGLLAVLGTWITARRWVGRWLAAASVWVFALSPMIIKIHAITASEVIIACMLAWMCVFILAEERSLWQIVLGSILGTFAVLTRQNMVVVLPLLVLYVFWQHGKQKGIASFVTCAVVFLAFHIYYWPNILTIWAPWLPESLTPFLDPFRLPKEATPIWNPSIDFWNRTIAFFQGIRYHFIPVVGSIFALIFLSLQRDWKIDPAKRAAVFLALLYFILFALHAWAAVASQYESYSCVYCFTPYLTFFDPLGIILSVIIISVSWKHKQSRTINVLSILVVLVISVGIGLSSFDNVGAALLNLPVPRMRDGQFLSGTTALVDFITNKFGLALTLTKRYLASVLGLDCWTWRLVDRIRNIAPHERRSSLALVLPSYCLMCFLQRACCFPQCSKQAAVAQIANRIYYLQTKNSVRILKVLSLRIVWYIGTVGCLLRPWCTSQMCVFFRRRSMTDTPIELAATRIRFSVLVTGTAN